MKTYKELVYILMQELFENGLFEIGEIKEKYDLTTTQEQKLKEIFEELYGN